MTAKIWAYDVRDTVQFVTLLPSPALIWPGEKKRHVLKLATLAMG